MCASCPLYPRKQTFVTATSMSASAGRSDTFFRPARLAAQERCEISNRFDDRGRLEPQFLGDLGGAALNPEGVQPGRRGAINVPGIRRDKAELGVCDFQALRRKIVDPRADLEDLHFF